MTFELIRVESSKKTNYLETEVDAWNGKYADPAKSDKKVTIKSGENALEPFALQ